MSATSRALANERSRSFYGDEAAGLPPEMLYEPYDAEQALHQANLVVESCRRLLDERI
ncbi:MAG: hypothetical protein NZ693_04390 [Thermoflexales bacterium]|nr:hypothetical protein [Thermoflexales bacterium]